MRTDAVVVGGGLAGITAAIELADAGMDVTLLEARARLGGLTCSFERDGLPVDTGQHVFLRCYHDYRALLDRLGTTAGTTIQPRLAMPVLAPGGIRFTLARSSLPAPLHLARAVLGYGALSRTERLRACRAAAALRRVDPHAPATDAESFGTWLRGHGQTSRTVDRLWSLIAVAALNVPADQASLALATRVFRTGLLDAADAGDLGIPRMPLGELHGAAATRLLDRLGVDVRLRRRVHRVRPENGGFRVTTPDDEVAADAVVVAVPHHRAADVVPTDAVPGAVRWGGLGASPIVNVHVVYADRVTDLDLFAAVGTPVQWAFDRTHLAGLRGGQYLAVSLSAADAYVSRPASEVSAEILGALAELLPRAARTRVRTVLVTREPRATFRPLPGTAALRPPQRTGLPGLALAGAWTDTGLPDTMESAVRSGLRAADAVTAALGATSTTEPVT